MNKIITVISLSAMILIGSQSRPFQTSSGRCRLSTVVDEPMLTEQTTTAAAANASCWAGMQHGVENR